MTLPIFSFENGCVFISCIYIPYMYLHVRFLHEVGRLWTKTIREWETIQLFLRKVLGWIIRQVIVTCCVKGEDWFWTKITWKGRKLYMKMKYYMCQILAEIRYAAKPHSLYVTIYIRHLFDYSRNIPIFTHFIHVKHN